MCLEYQVRVTHFILCLCFRLSLVQENQGRFDNLIHVYMVVLFTLRRKRTEVRVEVLPCHIGEVYHRITGLILNKAILYSKM